MRTMILSVLAKRPKAKSRRTATGSHFGITGTSFMPFKSIIAPWHFPARPTPPHFRPALKGIFPTPAVAVGSQIAGGPPLDSGRLLVGIFQREGFPRRAGVASPVQPHRVLARLR